MKSTFVISALLAIAVPLAGNVVRAQPPGANYDESKVGTYTLPDPLVASDGTAITSAKAWREKRRPELLELFRTHVFGRSPAVPTRVAAEPGAVDRTALGGTAIRQEVRVSLSGTPSGPWMTLLLYTPRGTTAPVPVFLGMNFDGNHTITTDAGVSIAPQWMWDARMATEQLVTPGAGTRGQSIGRWPLETIIARGYALATIARADVEADYATGWTHGLRAALSKDRAGTRWSGDDWGAIGAWAWALSRAFDYLATDARLDARRVVLIGHSRLGKAALWAAAQDERFAVVVSNESGEGGAALARRNFGETVERITTVFPHWFCANFTRYAQDVASLPVDQHELLALIAPRPLYVASAAGDQWSDPKGEFLAAVHAAPVYRLFGTHGLGTDQWPGVDTPVGDTIRYHVRTGKHDVTAYDWAQYLDFADRQFGRK